MKIHPLHLAAAGVALVAVIGCGSSGEKGTSVATPGASASTAAQQPAKTNYQALAKTDLKLEVEIKKKTCFGSAGCLVDFRIKVTYLGAKSLDPEKTYEVTYDVKGAQDPLTNTFEITGTQAHIDELEHTQTASTKFTLTAVVTSIAEK